MKDSIDSIEAHTEAQSKYNKKNAVGFYMKLNIHRKGFYESLLKYTL